MKTNKTKTTKTSPAIIRADILIAFKTGKATEAETLAKLTDLMGVEKAEFWMASAKV